MKKKTGTKNRKRKKTNGPAFHCLSYVNGLRIRLPEVQQVTESAIHKQRLQKRVQVAGSAQVLVCEAIQQKKKRKKKKKKKKMMMMKKKMK
jgi:hypothetical protein